MWLIKILNSYRRIIIFKKFLKVKFNSKSPIPLQKMQNWIEMSSIEIPVAICQPVCEAVRAQVKRCIESYGGQT